MIQFLIDNKCIFLIFIYDNKNFIIIKKYKWIRNMDYTQIGEVLKKHTRWLQSAKNQGERAELCGEDLSNIELKEVVFIEADLSGADLRAANLVKANLKDVNFKGSYLREATLRGANLIGADLMGCNGIGAIFREAFLREANFVESHLIGTDFREANCIEANFYRAKLLKADLRGATAVEANFSETEMGNARCRRVNFRGADLRGANLKGADLSHADFSYADLSDANLTDTDLREARFVRSNLHRTNFADSDMRDIRIDNDSNEQISQMIKEQFEHTWVYEKVKDHLFNNISIIKSEFPVEYRNAALVLLYNFPFILNQTDPSLQVKLNMEYDSNSTSLSVNLINGEVEDFHQALNDYALVLAGKRSVESYATDAVVEKEFKKVIQLANYSIEPINNNYSTIGEENHNESHGGEQNWAGNDNRFDLHKLHEVGNLLLDNINKEVRV